MRKIAALLAMLALLPAVVLSATSVDATTIEFQVPFQRIGPVLTGGSASADLLSSGLNGVMFQGQTLSLDFVLADDVLARMFRSPTTSIDVQLATNATGSPGIPSSLPTGFLIGRDGVRASNTVMGTWSQFFVPDGSVFMFLNLGVTVVDLNVPASYCCSGAFEMSGVHFDVTLPNTGFVITATHLRLFDGFKLQFGTAAQLPEPSTLLLLLIGVPTVLVLDRTRRRSATGLREPA